MNIQKEFESKEFESKQSKLSQRIENYLNIILKSKILQNLL